MKHVRSKDGEMLAKPFIEVCKLIVPIVDKFGMSMAIVKADISGNISKLESKYTSDPSKFEFLYDMVRVEIETKTAKSSTSCTTGVLWLTRAMDFLVELLRNLMDHSDWSMTKACMESYNRTLKRWHGWLATSSFNVALKIIPDRKRFLETIACGSDDINADIQRFCSAFSPLLEANHKFLVSCSLLII
ncbi:hypothetical protein AXF42_Ash019487 [Apostasia shenzhenica]|uniref:Glycolipid transfer protein domain-containing protein n=1 Tax=Apostasia shenzhenica TaxID=1088818 RepID=A0A2I0AYI4_9ASPA|nr:hypothetical protein AXF42_Ash019487 [Apostasia shenzhenica]